LGLALMLFTLVGCLKDELTADLTVPLRRLSSGRRSGAGLRREMQEGKRWVARIHRYYRLSGAYVVSKLARASGNRQQPATLAARLKESVAFTAATVWPPPER